MEVVGICGNFGGNTVALNGQTVKTKILTEALRRELGPEAVETVDTYGGAKKTLIHLWKLGRLFAGCRNVVILPAHNAVRIFTPYLTFLNCFRKRKLHYVVIGGWLPEFLQSRPRLAKSLRKFDGIYVETTGMMDKLRAMDFSNVILMKNCKNLKILSKEEVKTNFAEPYPLCTFSRVNAEKGIEDAVQAVENVNAILGRTAYQLDIYGQIENGYQERFEELQKKFPAFVRYGGMVPFDGTTEVLQNYYALLFPTHYKTEGIPGTFIDAYAAGVPGISARWENFRDVVREGLTGLGYDMGDNSQLEQLLLDCAQNPEQLLKMRTSCIREAKNYLPEQEIKVLIEKL